MYGSRIAASLIALALLGGCAGVRPGSIEDTQRGVAARFTPPHDPQIDALIARGKLQREDLRRIARALNPELARMRSNIDVARGRMREAGLYPNPSVEVGQTGVPVSRDGQGMTEAYLAQPIIVGRRRSAAVEAAEAELAAAERMYDARARALDDAIDAAWVEYLFYRESASASMDLLDIVDRDHALASERERANPEEPHESLRAHVHITELELEVTRFTSERLYAFQRLTRLMGTTAPRINDIEGEMLPGTPRGLLQYDKDTAIAQHPDSALAVARIRAAEFGARVPRAERIPDITLRAGGSYDNDMDEGFVGGGLVIPIPVFDRNQGRIEEADSLIEASRLDAEDTRQRLDLSFTESSQMVTEYDTLATVYADAILPAAAAAHAKIVEDYLGEKVGFINVLDGQRTLINARLKSIEYRYLLNLAIARLRNLRGDGDPIAPAEHSHLSNVIQPTHSD